MIPLLSAIVVASLLGSTHCAGMCGAFVAFAVVPGGAKAPPRWTLNAAYNLGRLTTYLVLGVAAGLLGSALDLGGSLVGVQRIAASLAGVIMVGAGVASLLRFAAVPVPRLPTPAFLTRAAKAAHARAFDFKPMPRAAIVGLLTTLLPCGWLYAFVIASAGTGDPFRGAAAMGAFWLGTLPVMGALGLGIQVLSGPFRRHLPLATSLLLTGAGLWTVFGRTMMSVPDTRDDQTPATVGEAIDAVHQIDGACPHCSPSEG